jgi:hypothetical protein
MFQITIDGEPVNGFYEDLHGEFYFKYDDNLVTHYIHESGDFTLCEFEL